MTFDGTDDLLRHAAGLFSGDTAGALFLVGRWSAVVDFMVGVCSADEATTTKYIAFRTHHYSSTPQMSVSQDDGGAATTIRGSTSITTNTNYVYAFVSTGAAYSFRVNGNDETETSSGGNGDWFGDTSARDNVVIGAQKTTSEAYFANGQIAEILAYSRELTTAEIERVERYLAARYGITL